jgi:hypothetical protein
MEGEFSWLVLVAVFVMVTGLCGILSVRLTRITGSPGEPGPGGEPASGRTAAGSSDRSSR